ncbi:MAG TPA: hypothetical protein VEU96_18175 [Bryobacteraceae bacterium]|nr:hypothetical protein [Bryobacteraceae bacterium]
MTRTIAALFLFGIAFGYLEASVVVYLRAIYDPIRLHIHPGRQPGELFPLISTEQLAAAGPEHPRQLVIEVGREAITIIMLAAFGLAAGRNFNQRMAAFAIAFGLWDISFYAFLKLMIHWPASLFTWDILFLIPLPWVGPVLAPCLVSLTLIVCGLISLKMGGLPASPLAWAAMIAGGIGVILSFVWDYRNTMAGGLPNPFNWPLFLASEALAVAGFIYAVKNRGYRESRTPRDS